MAPPDAGPQFNRCLVGFFVAVDIEALAVGSYGAVRCYGPRLFRVAVAVPHDDRRVIGGGIAAVVDAFGGEVASDDRPASSGVKIAGGLAPESPTVV